MAPPDDGQQLRLPFLATARRRRTPLIPARVRVELVRESEPIEPIALRGSGDVYNLLKDEVASWDRERFLTLLLDNKHVLIGIEEASVGCLTSAVVHPREIFKSIILASAAAFMMVHNHPSGDPTPSKEDIEITRRLREVGELMGVRVLDHIVIGKGRYVSFVDDGYW
jgi:DNA repair protein RadC